MIASRLFQVDNNCLIACCVLRLGLLKIVVHRFGDVEKVFVDACIFAEPSSMRAHYSTPLQLTRMFGELDKGKIARNDFI